MLFNEAMAHKFKLDTFVLSCSNLLFFLIYDLYFGILSLKYFIPYDYKDCIYLIFFIAYIIISFPNGSVGKESSCNAGDTEDEGSIPESGRSPGGGNGNPLQYSYLEKSHGQRNLAGFSPWGRKELNLTKRLSTHTQCGIIFCVCCELGSQVSFFSIRIFMLNSPRYFPYLNPTLSSLHSHITLTWLI